MCESSDGVNFVATRVRAHARTHLFCWKQVVNRRLRRYITAVAVPRDSSDVLTDARIVQQSSGILGSRLL
jgi:hypothetical protein